MARDLEMLNHAHDKAWSRRSRLRDISTQEEYLGAVVTTRHQVESAVNRTRFGTKCPTHHAEIRALAKIGSPKNATVYVARADAYGRWANAKPCAGCEDALRKAGVKRVWWTVSPGVSGNMTL